MADTVLILGGSGFIGSALAMALARTGVAVIAVGGRAPPAPHPLLEFIPGRVDNEANLSDLVSRSTKVVHMATASTPGASIARPMHEIDANLRLTAMLLECLHRNEGRELLYFSSGGALYADAGGGWSTESDIVRPRSYHGVAKLASEHLIAAWCGQAAGTAIALRPSNVYGPGQHGKGGFAIIPTALGRIASGEPLVVWGDGSARRDYIFIADLIDLCRRILSRPMMPGFEIFNACSGLSVSLNELFVELETVTGRPLARMYDSARRVDASDIAMSPALAAQRYDWLPATSLREGLQRTWAWLREQGDA